MMSFGIHPVVLAAAIGAFIALLAITVACLVRNGTVRTTMIVLAIVCSIPAGFVFLAVHPELADGRFRTYKSFYRDIQIGMTREQVLQAMQWRYPAEGNRKQPKIMEDTAERLGFFMNPESSREPNCEGIFLTLEKGRVIKKDYSPD